MDAAAPLASYPIDGTSALRAVARVLVEGLLGGLALALLVGAAVLAVGGGNPLWTVVALPFTGPIGMVLGLVAALVALVLVRATTSRDRRLRQLTSPSRTALLPAVVVGALLGLVVLLVLSRLDGGETLPAAAGVALVSGVGVGAVVRWRAATLLRDRALLDRAVRADATTPQTDGVRSSMPHGES